MICEIKSLVLDQHHWLHRDPERHSDEVVYIPNPIRAPPNTAQLSPTGGYSGLQAELHGVHMHDRDPTGALPNHNQRRTRSLGAGRSLTGPAVLCTTATLLLDQLRLTRT